ncbi:MAG: arsenate reductase (glutaredoxin) [Gammaproteobacteria bacterium]
MSQITIYHNPRCSKSRQTLDLLMQQGFEPEIIEYLKTPPDSITLQHLLKLLKLSAKQLIRTHEAEYKQYHLDDPKLKEIDLIAAMVKYPKLIQRPIVVHNGKAALGRPPENVLDLL